MRDVELKVRYEVPQGKELQKLTHKSAVTYIYIGKLSRKGSPENIDRYFIQLNEQLASIEEIKTYLEKERAKMNDEDRSRMVVSIKADKQVPMGIIADVKKELQSAFALKINYSAVETN
jgi:biopolymer transport protein ExbD